MKVPVPVRHTWPHSIGLVALSAACLCFAEEGDSFEGLSVSGDNILQCANGYRDIDQSSTKKPGDYLTDYLNFDVQMRKLFLQGRFQIDQPSLGYDPSSPVFREFFSRRAVGFNGRNMTFKAGHFMTTFGRGLSLALKEDVTIERATILDGVFMDVHLPLLEIQGLAGRSMTRKVNTVSIDTDDYDEETGETIVIKLELDNPGYRDNIFGIDVASYPFSRFESVPLLSACAVGAGIVDYRSDVSAIKAGREIDTITIDSMGVADTTFVNRYYQNRKNTFLPSIHVELSTGSIDAYAEHARMLYRSHTFVDTLFDERIVDDAESYATYVSLGACFLDFSLMGEYKNYFYGKDNNQGCNVIVEGEYVEPPSARHRHIWQLLTKHVPANTVRDVIGYRLALDWSRFENATFALSYCCGGRHKNRQGRYSLFTFGNDENEDYWDIYIQSNLSIGSRFISKIGANYGKIDPYEPEARYATVGSKFDLGPFLKAHSVGLALELQRNSKEFRAERDSAAVIAVAGPYTPVDESAFDYYSDVPDELKSVHRQWTWNLVATASYSLSPYFAFSATLEKETPFFQGQPVLQSDVTSSDRYYRSVGIKVRPVENHSIQLEAGSYSGGQKCTLGECVMVPSFEGVRLSITSLF
jgi:hypothetical protein